MNTSVIYFLLPSLLVMPVVSADTEALLSEWEVSVAFVPPGQERLQVFLDVQNKGTEKVSGVQLSVAAEGLEYIEEEKLSFEGDETPSNMRVTVGQVQDKSVITIMFLRPIDQGYSEQVLLDFSAKGLLQRQGEGYTAVIHFDEPKIILENRDKVGLNADSGSFRVHVPEGHVYTEYDPSPWREIWQGVSGFKAHYILIFDGGTPLTTPVTVSFKESQIIMRAVDLYGKVLDLESTQTMPQEDLDNANRRITEAATYVIYGDEGLAEIELDKAESILTGKSLEEIPTLTETKEISRKGIYVLGIVFIVLVLVSLKFGKNIISTIGGGKKDD